MGMREYGGGIDGIDGIVRRRDARNAEPRAGLTDVVFDFCGVLVDWQPRLAVEGLFDDATLDEFFDESRSEFIHYDDLHDGGMDYDELLGVYERAHGPRMAAVMRAYAERFEMTLPRMVPGMDYLVDDLRRAGVRLWGLTNWGHDNWPVAVARFPRLMAALGGVVVSGDEKLKKPDAPIFRLAIERFGLDPSHALFVDDTAVNVTGSEDAGLPAVLFTSAPALRATLAMRGVRF